MASSLETLQRELRSGSLTDFTARRDAAAAELSAAGRRADAAALRRLKKPAASLWAINRLARVDPEAVRALVDQAEGVRRDTRAASDPDAARTTLEQGRALRARVQQLEERAAQLLVDSGTPATAPTRARIHTTLLGVTGASRDERRALLEGTLDHELAPPAFSDVLASMPAGPRRAARGPRPQPGRKEPGNGTRAASSAGGAAVSAQAFAPRLSARDQRRAARARADLERLEREARRAAVEAERAESRARERRERADALARRAAEARGAAQAPRSSGPVTGRDPGDPSLVP